MKNYCLKNLIIIKIIIVIFFGCQKYIVKSDLEIKHAFQSAEKAAEFIAKKLNDGILKDELKNTLITVSNFTKKKDNSRNMLCERFENHLNSKLEAILAIDPKDTSKLEEHKEEIDKSGLYKPDDKKIYFQKPECNITGYLDYYKDKKIIEVFVKLSSNITGKVYFTDSVGIYYEGPDVAYAWNKDAPKRNQSRSNSLIITEATKNEFNIKWDFKNKVIKEYFVEKLDKGRWKPIIGYINANNIKIPEKPDGRYRVLGSSKDYSTYYTNEIQPQWCDNGIKVICHNNKDACKKMLEKLEIIFNEHNMYIIKKDNIFSSSTLEISFTTNYKGESGYKKMSKYWTIGGYIKYKNTVSNKSFIVSDKDIEPNKLKIFAESEAKLFKDKSKDSFDYKITREFYDRFEKAFKENIIQ